MDTDQWPQGGCTTIVAVNEVDNTSTKPAEKKPRPEKEQALNCPRCNSTNTKFCYYNNYSLSQPRYFCKTCRRYWTQGGSLRTVPVGGGSRKNNKRSISNNNPNSISSKKILPDLTQPQNPNKIHTQQQDLNLAYNPSNFNGSSEFFSSESKSQNPNYDPSTNSSFMELFKNGNLGNSSGGGLGLSSFMSAPVSDSNVFSSGFAMSDQFIKPSLSFSLDGLENGFGNLGQDLNINPSRLSLLSFEDVKMPVSNAVVSTNEFAEHHEQDRGTGEQAGEANEYWSGMLAGGSSW